MDSIAPQSTVTQQFRDNPPKESERLFYEALATAREADRLYTLAFQQFIAAEAATIAEQDAVIAQAVN
jgi:hypothetical protein